MTGIILYVITAIITMFIASTIIFVYAKDWTEGLQYMGAALAAGIFCFVTIPFVIIVGGAWLVSKRIKSNMRKLGYEPNSNN
jgi:hypothetical protein